MRDQPADFAVHRCGHAGIGRHRARALLPFLIRQFRPVGAGVHGHHGNAGGHHAPGNRTGTALAAQRGPARGVAPGIGSNIGIGRLQRRVVGDEVHRSQKRLSTGVAAVDIADHPVDNQGRGIETRRQFRRLAVLAPFGLVINEQIGLIFKIVGARLGQRKRMIIAARRGQAVGRVAQMPFPGQIGAVAASAQLIGNGHHAVVEVRVIAGLALMFRWDCLWHVAQAGTVVDHARLQHRPRGRA